MTPADQINALTINQVIITAGLLSGMGGKNGYICIILYILMAYEGYLPYL
jgi:hypothetical protein